MAFYLVFTDDCGGRHSRPIIGNLKKAITLFKSTAKRSKETALYRDNSTFHSTTQLSHLVVWHSPTGECYWANCLLANCFTKKEKATIASRRLEPEY